MRMCSLVTDIAGRLMDKTLHHHIWSVERPLSNTPVLVLSQCVRKTTLDKLICFLGEAIASPCQY